MDPTLATTLDSVGQPIHVVMATATAAMAWIVPRLVTFIRFFYDNPKFNQILPSMLGFVLGIPITIALQPATFIDGLTLFVAIASGSAVGQVLRDNKKRGLTLPSASERKKPAETHDQFRSGAM